MHNYHDTHGRLPAVVHGEDGTPLYCWRVLLLPFIEQEELYNQFKLDEPWNSPHNITLLPRMPATYALPPRKMAKMNMPPDHTICHVFVGRQAPFEEEDGLNLRDFPHGTSNTILIMEAGEPVPWTKPEELVYDPDGPLPDLRSPFKDVFRVALGNGSSRHISKTISEATLRAAITRNGGDTLGRDW